MKRLICVVVVGAIVWGGSSWPALALSLEKLAINGFLDLEYEKADGPGHTTTPVGDENGSFDQVHFNLLMEFPVSDTVVAKGHIEYEHGPSLEDKQGDIRIEWAYIEYLLNNVVTLRGGLANTPFGHYNEIHDATPTYLSIQVPWEIYKAQAVGGHAMFPKFSTGLFVLGRNALPAGVTLNYTAYLVNGENDVENEAEKDENPEKSFGGQVTVSSLDGVTVGGSYYQGEEGAPPTGEDHVAWAATLDLSLRPIGLRAEYAASHLGSVTQSGWYGEAFASVERLTPYVRYGAFDPDQNAGDDVWTALISGLNFRVQPNVVLKLEHRHFSGEPSNTKVNQDYNEVAAAIAVAF